MPCLAIENYPDSVPNVVPDQSRQSESYDHDSDCSN